MSDSTRHFTLQRAFQTAESISEHLASVNRRSISPSHYRTKLATVTEQYLQDEEDDQLMVLLFGSAARCEPSRDLDLLFIYIGSGQDEWHRYSRERRNGLEIDLNIASETWLQKSINDIEWGYCLAESFLLGSSHPDLENSWRQLVAKAQRPGRYAERIDQHFQMSGQLQNAAESVIDKRPIFARVLAHEALRCLAMATIEQFGGRVFSHGTFIKDYYSASLRAGVSVLLMEEVARCLAGVDSTIAITPESLASRYREARKIVSLALRGPLTDAGAYAVSRPRVERILLLTSDASSNQECDALEKQLAGLGLHESLTSFPLLHSVIMTADRIARATVKTSESIHARSAGLKHLHATKLSVPLRNASKGTRWVEYRDNRLKVILTTGGCRTPSCTFCTLPYYGRSASNMPASATVQQFLRVYKPQTLALYNDGSFLNPSEIPRDELVKTCKVIRRADVQGLAIESIPRFVTDEVLEVLRCTSGVTDLTVAMGFQCVGDWAAVQLLGRPDPDALFDRAIHLLKKHAIKIRVYLLWGFPVLSKELWEDRMTQSLEWLHRRAIDQVTICPYVAPTQHTSQGSHSFCSLRKLLERWSQETSTFTIDVALPDRPSCGQRYYADGCPACYQSLVMGEFSNQPCVRSMANTPMIVPTALSDHSILSMDHRSAVYVRQLKTFTNSETNSSRDPQG